MGVFHISIKTVDAAQNVFSVFAADAQAEPTEVRFDSQQVNKLVARLYEENESDRLKDFGKQDDLCTELGELLFNAFFVGEALDRFKKYKEHALAGGERIRIGLHLPNELYYLPWEVLRDRFLPERNFFSLQGSLIRYDVTTPISNTLLAKPHPGPAKFLFLFPNAGKRFSPLGSFKLVNSTNLIIDPVDPATWDNFEERVREAGLLGMLFFGHGDILENEGVLLFVKETFEGRSVITFDDDVRYGYSISEVISSSGLYMACILACESAWTQNKIQFNKSIAGALLRGTELAFVVGAQRRIGSLSTQAFLAKLLDAIAEGDPLDRAISRGRTSIRAMDPAKPGQKYSRLDWWIPVVYTKTLNLDIFPKNPDHPYVPPPIPESLTVSNGVTIVPREFTSPRGFFKALGSKIQSLITSERDSAHEFLER